MDTSRQQKIVVAVVLLAATFLVYAPIKDHEFVDYDDNVYITESQVQLGFTSESVTWAFTSFTNTGNWHPLTWLSHMLDWELFGPDPGRHHLVGVGFHLLNVLLVFVVLQRMTGAVWPSALAAGLFALHPLNVQSVAWASQRKSLLSTSLWLLTMWAYIGYGRRPNWGRYLGVMGLLVLGLMSKSMLVTLPCVLLLLDYWPLGRLGTDWTEFRQRLPRLVGEKLPLFLLVAGISVLTVHSQSAGISSEIAPLQSRVANAVLAYVLYLKMMVWPTDLAVYYPHPRETLSLVSVAGAALVLALISLGVWWRGRRARYLTVGWLWYLGTLVPVIGLIQVAGHAMADRYAYVPLLGVFIMLAWGAAEVLERRWFIGAGACILAALACSTSVQLRYWQDTATLSERAIAVTSDNYLAYTLLGAVKAKENKIDEAQHLFEKALKIDSSFGAAQRNLGNVLYVRGRQDEAIEWYNRYLQSAPNDTAMHYQLGVILSRKGDAKGAIHHFSEALRINPHHPKAQENLNRLRARSRTRS
jgi:tetratricopeptide (TPR) repeat protein